jgi:mannose-6-phosphate isomerase-like protein (cupin superfamily)
MTTRERLIRILLTTLGALMLISVAEGPAQATPAEGVTFEVLSRATVPAFDARRTYRQLIKGPAHPRDRFWKIEVEATRMIDVVTVRFTVQPGGHGGWHTHPGPAFFTVSQGELTMYDANDPFCAPQVFPAGTGSLEAGTTTHNHMLRNETGSVAETIVTFLVPVGALLRVDMPDPGTCPF